MFRRFLRHKVNRDKGLLLIFPKHPLFPRLLRGTFVGNVKVGLDRPLIPTAFVANLLRSPRVARPTVRPTGGLQVRRRRSGTGRPAVAEDGRVRRPRPEPAFEVPGSGRAWLGGPTDARENLKKLRRQLGLRNN